MVVQSKLHNARHADYASMRADLLSTIKKGMKKHKVVGLSLALVDDDEIVWAEGFGYADKQKKRLADEYTLYKTGSITKIFTALAVMQLVDKKQLNLDEPIQTYLPELNIKYHVATTEPITLRRIMNHTSGFPVDQMSGMFNKKPDHFSSVVDFLNNNHAPYAPNTIATYSNLAMDLIGVIIERVSGQSYETYVTNNLLRPLGMTHSVLREGDANKSHMSLGYKKGKFNEEYAIRSVPAGNLHSNVMEMSQFIKSVLQNNTSLISQKSFDEMTAEQTNHVKLDSGVKFGLNWFLVNPQLTYAGNFLGHNGGTINFVSVLMILPEQKLGVIVLSNSAMQIQFVEEMAVEILQRAVKIKHGLVPPADKSWPRILSPENKIASAMHGDYATPLGFVNISQDKKGLFANALGKKVSLQYHEDGWFSLKFKLFGLFPVPVPGLGKIRVQVKEVENKKILYVEEQKSFYIIGMEFSANPISSAWRSRLGEYRVDYREGDYHWVDKVVLQEKHGILFFNTKGGHGNSSLIINPLSDDMAVFEGIGRAMQETIYAKGEGDKSELFYSGYRLIRFKH